jgi:CO/xanthine dehydrogenase FAD-binding subunit
MKPAPFDYLAPATLDDAIGALAAAGDDAKVLAGGSVKRTAVASSWASSAVVSGAR